MTVYGDRPAFIDPVHDDIGEELGAGRAPRWFVLLSVVLLVATGYYLGAFWSGPRLSSPHNFVHGVQPAAGASAEPSPSATP